MRNDKATIAAIIMLIVSLAMAFFVNFNYKNRSKKNDVEIFIVKNKEDIAATAKKIRFCPATYNFILGYLKSKRRFCHSLIDSYEYELAIFWQEVLNHFEIFDYYKMLPKAFIRRLIFMPTFTGNKDYFVEKDSFEKATLYPDSDYRSTKYRLSFVPSIISRAKKVIDFFYYRFLYAFPFKLSIN